MATCPAGSTRIECDARDCGDFPCCALLTPDANVIATQCSSTPSCDTGGVGSAQLCIDTTDCPGATTVPQCCPIASGNYRLCGGSGPNCY
jgi:hypothetical protein